MKAVVHCSMLYKEYIVLIGMTDSVELAKTWNWKPFWFVKLIKGDPTTEHEGDEHFNVDLVHDNDNEEEMDVEFIRAGSYSNWVCYLVNQCLFSLSTQSCWWWLAPLSSCRMCLILSLSGLARFYFRHFIRSPQTMLIKRVSTSGWQVNKGWSHYRTWRWRRF
jgi:hypothetical protein